MSLWHSLDDEVADRSKTTWEMYETMRDSRKSATDSIATLTPYRLAAHGKNRSFMHSIYAKCRTLAESLALELLIILFVVLSLAVITVQLLLDTQVFSIGTGPTFCNLSQVGEASNQAISATFAVTAQCQYALTAVALFFMIECCVRICLVRHEFSSFRYFMMINVIDAASCIIFGAITVTFTVLTYTRLTLQTYSSSENQQFMLVRDCVNYFVAFRLVRVTLIICGATGRARKELCNTLAQKMSECAYLFDRTAQLERRVAELEAKAGTKSPNSVVLAYSNNNKDAILNGQQTARGGHEKNEPVTVVEIHSSRERERDSRKRPVPDSISKLSLLRPGPAAEQFSNGAFEPESDIEDESLQPSNVIIDSTEPTSASQPPIKMRSRVSSNLEDRAAHDKSGIPDDAEAENPNGETRRSAVEDGDGLTPEAEAVIQRLYELGLEWEAAIDDPAQDGAVEDGANSSKNAHEDTKADKIEEANGHKPALATGSQPTTTL